MKQHLFNIFMDWSLPVFVALVLSFFFTDLTVGGWFFLGTILARATS